MRERMAVVLDYLTSGASRILTSFKSLVASPSAWLAVAVVFAAGFTAGHLERGRVLKKVRSDRDTLLSVSESYRARVSAAENATHEARKKIDDAEQEITSLKEKLAKLSGKRRFK